MGSALLALSHLPRVILHFLSLEEGESRNRFSALSVATAWQLGEQGDYWLGSPLLSLVLLGLSQSSSKYLEEHLCTQFSSVQ